MPCAVITFMRTLLRDTKRGTYYLGGGQWTRNHRRALDFELIEPALRYARNTGLLEVEVVFAFDDPALLPGVPLDRFEWAHTDESVCSWF